MSKTYTSILIFMDNITIVPHTASLAKHLCVPVSIAEFAAGEPVTLMREDSTGEYVVRNRRTGEFMEGLEWPTTEPGGDPGC